MNEDKVLKYEKNNTFKVPTEVNNKMCNKCDCVFVSNNENENSEEIIKKENQNSIHDVNPSPRNIVGYLHEDQSVVQEVDIECRVAGEEIYLHILCIVRQQVCQVDIDCGVDEPNIQ